MNNSVPQAIDPLKEFENIVDRLKNITSTSKDNSDRFYEKATRLLPFGLDCDQEKSTERPPSEGVVNQLFELIDRLAYINRRNDEIIRHLNSMV